MMAHYIVGKVQTAAGEVPRVSTALTARDVLGSWAARWGVNRMNYAVPPGLYCVGDADENSPVIVSANYKMSFDVLRKNLAGLTAWILVIDTVGINVWCAAGKGTFGTDEIVGRLATVNLAKVVSHRTLIVPQLGAPGVAAHEVSRQFGFRVVYGPVRASDLPAFLAAGLQAAPAMRRVNFTFWDRLILTPIELVGVIKFGGDHWRRPGYPAGARLRCAFDGCPLPLRRRYPDRLCRRPGTVTLAARAGLQP
jgi:hypothetical protein